MYLKGRCSGRKLFLQDESLGFHKQYLKEGHFAKGSMSPKIEAAIQFVEHGGRETIITEVSQLGKEGTGTRIVLY